MEAILTPVFFCALVGIVLFILSKTLLPFLRATIPHRRLMRTGTEANATILTVSQTGLYVNRMPQVKLEVQVQPAGGRSFIAEVRHVLDFVQIPHFQSGRSVRVKYNPANPKQVTLVQLAAAALWLIAGIPMVG